MLPEHDALCPYFHDTEWSYWVVNEGPRIRWSHMVEDFDKDVCPWCAFVKMVRDDERGKHGNQ